MISYLGGQPTKYTQGEYVFAIRQYTPFRAMKVLGELQKIIAPALGGAIDGFKGQHPEADIQSMQVIGTVVSDTLSRLADCVDGDKLENAAQLLLDPQYISVAPVNTKDFQALDESAINEVFSGRPIDMMALMAKVFKVNFLDFSKLYSAPTGVRKALVEMKQSFRGSALMNSDK